MALTLTPPPEKRGGSQVPNIEEIVALACLFIDSFFQDKSPDSFIDLHQTRFIKLVVNSSVMNNAQHIYDCIGIENAGVRLKNRQAANKLIALYTACSQKGIPKEFASGLILMDYIVCKGIDIFDEE